MVWIRIGHARSRSPRKRRAVAAVLLRYMPMKTHRLALLIATKRYPRDVSLAMCGGYFTSMWVYPGSGAFKPLCLDLSILGCTVTKASRSMPTQTGSRPERDIVGFRNSCTTANRVFSDSRHVLRSASPPQPVALWSGWSEDGGGLRCLTLSRLRHFQTVCSVVAWRSAKTHAGSSRA